MLAPYESICNEDMFFNQWSSSLTFEEKFDWTVMKERLKQKGQDKKWFVVKSVDEVDQAPPLTGAAEMPSFIILERKASAEKDASQAPRFRLRKSERTEDVDEESVILDDIVDMKGLYEWRQFIGAIDGTTIEDVYVLAVSGATSDGPAVARSGSGAAAASPSAASPPTRRKLWTEYGKVSPSSSTGRWSHRIASARSPAPSTPGGDWSPCGKVSPTGLVIAPWAAIEGLTIRPVLFAATDPDHRPDSSVPLPSIEFESFRETLDTGNKVVVSYKRERTDDDPRGVDFKRIKVENDIAFAKKYSSKEKKAVVHKIIEDELIASLEDYPAHSKLKEHYDKLHSINQEPPCDDGIKESQEARRAKILEHKDMKKLVSKVKRTHTKGIVSVFSEICQKRADKYAATRLTLSCIEKGIRDGKVCDRSGYDITRIFPGAGSQG